MPLNIRLIFYRTLIQTQIVEKMRKILINIIFHNTMINNKSIMITGAAGFIGSHLTETLLKHNNFLVLIDNFNDYYPGKEEQLQKILKNYGL